MRFARSGSIPIVNVGTEHLSWQSKLALEHRSNLVLKEGLVQPKQITSMLHTNDWLSTESFNKQKDTFSPERSRVREDQEDPYERFPRLFEDSATKTLRRGYYAPWTRCQFELIHHLEPTDNKSRKQLFIERNSHPDMNKKTVVAQRTRMRQLHQEKLHHASEAYCLCRNSPVRSEHNYKVRKQNSSSDVHKVSRKKERGVKLPKIKKNRF